MALQNNNTTNQKEMLEEESALTPSPSTSSPPKSPTSTSPDDNFVPIDDNNACTVQIEKKKEDRENLLDLCAEKIGDLRYPEGCWEEENSWTITFLDNDTAKSAVKYFKESRNVFGPFVLKERERPVKTTYAQYLWRIWVSSIPKQLDIEDLKKHFAKFKVAQIEMDSRRGTAELFFEKIEDWNEAKKQYTQSVQKGKQKHKITVREAWEPVRDPTVTKLCLATRNGGWPLTHEEIANIFFTEYRVKTLATGIARNKKGDPQNFAFAYISSKTYNLRFKDQNNTVTMVCPFTGKQVEWGIMLAKDNQKDKRSQSKSPKTSPPKGSPPKETESPPTKSSPEQTKETPLKPKKKGMTKARSLTETIDLEPESVPLKPPKTQLSTPSVMPNSFPPYPHHFMFPFYQNANSNWFSPNNNGNFPTMPSTPWNYYQLPFPLPNPKPNHEDPTPSKGTQE